MTVYVIPRQRNNLWLGGSGGGGILDLLGKALIDPMVNRDALARQYKYDARLADQKHNLDMEAKRAQWGRDDVLVAQHDKYVSQNPNAAPGIGGAMATAALLNGGDKRGQFIGDMNQYGQYLLPQYKDVDTGGKIVSRQMSPMGNELRRDEFDKSLSPWESGYLDMANKQRAFEEEMQRDKNAREWYVARQTAAANRGGGAGADNWLSPFADVYKAIGGGDIFGASGGGFSIDSDGNVSSVGGNGASGPYGAQVGAMLDLVNEAAIREFEKRYGPLPQQESPELEEYDSIEPETTMVQQQAPARPGWADSWWVDPEYKARLGLNPRGWKRAGSPTNDTATITPRGAAEASPRQPNAQSWTITRANLEKIAQQEGVSYEQLLSDAEAQGIRVID